MSPVISKRLPTHSRRTASPAAPGDSPASAPPLPDSLGSATAALRPRPAPPHCSSTEALREPAPLQDCSWGRGRGAGMGDPQSLATLSWVKTPSAHLHLPATLQIKPGGGPVGGCCPNAGKSWGGGGGIEAGGAGPGEAAAFRPRLLIALAARVGLGLGFLRSSWAKAGLPALDTDARLPLTSPTPSLQKQKAQCHLPQLFLSLRFLAMVVRESLTVRRCHCAARSASGPRSPAVGGSVPALGAVRSDSEEVAVALVGRSGEEKGGESG